MIAALGRVLLAWWGGRSHRRNVGGTWYCVANQATGWGGKYWTQTKPTDAECEVIDVEDYAGGAK